MPSEYNKLIIITAPSGAGKTSITNYLLKTFSDKLAFSVSATTRKKRDHEIDGVHYYFISEEDDPYKEKWIKPYSILASLYNMVILGTTSVGVYSRWALRR